MEMKKYFSSKFDYFASEFHNKLKTKFSENDKSFRAENFIHKRLQKQIYLGITYTIILALFIITALFLIFTTLSLLLKIDISILKNDKSIIKALFITVNSLILSSVLVFILGLPFTFFLSTKNNKISKAIEIISFVPIIIPPTIVGMAMFAAYGRRGNINFIIKNINLSFNFTSLILVQVFVGIPFFIQIVKEGFDSITAEVIEAAKIDGVNFMEMLLHIYIPLNKKSIMIGLFISFLRGAGEFGATMMFAGNISSRTQTITTLIYSYSQNSIEKALSLSGIYILLFIIPLFFIKILNKKEITTYERG